MNAPLCVPVVILLNLDRTAVRSRQGPWNIFAKKKNLPIVYWQVFQLDEWIMRDNQYAVITGYANLSFLHLQHLVL